MYAVRDTWQGWFWQRWSWRRLTLRTTREVVGEIIDERGAPLEGGVNEPHDAENDAEQRERLIFRLVHTYRLSHLRSRIATSHCKDRP